jgi:chromosome segregation ATPase
MFNSNTRNLTQLNTKYMQKVEQMKKEIEHYKKEYEVSKEEVLRVENELQHQRKVIADLKDTIKNIVEEEEELKEELNKKSKLDVFKDFIKKD